MVAKHVTPPGVSEDQALLLEGVVQHFADPQTQDGRSEHSGAMRRSHDCLHQSGCANSPGDHRRSWGARRPRYARHSVV